MGSRICMNRSCGVKISSLWKKGWLLKSGAAALLCSQCGSAYEKGEYCETYHAEETGWRECSLCNKRLHCGCSASLPFLEIQDFGGVWCLPCSLTAASPPPAREDGVFCEAQPSRNSTDTHNPPIGKVESDTVVDDDLLGLANIVDNHAPTFLPQSTTPLINGSSNLVKPDVNSTLGAADLSFPNLSPGLTGQPPCPQTHEDNTNSAVKDVQEPQVNSLSISLHSPAETSHCGLSFSSGGEGDKSKSTIFQSGQRPRQILPRPPKSNLPKGYDANKNSFSPMRVARPPAEGRLRNQLLPRYWPRITDQELQKLSGDLNSTIVPLFEKVLSASDASRIGRLVLPKACAEAYFPPINQSEGIPVKIQDVKGSEWTFQFRFWPNNNSRMYVLEGVNPCIQAMQLQAGDTVTFSRIDPGGKLVIGYRKASSIIEMQDIQISLPNPSGPASAESFYSDVTDGLSAGNGHSGPQSVVGDKDNQLSALPELSDVVNGDTVWSRSETVQNNANEETIQQPKLTLEKKRMRNISSKSKRLLIHNEDAIELRLTWEETQDLLRPPPSIKPTIVKIEDFEIEEYSEPPVFGKRTFFTTHLSGVQEQWTQCDKCSKWRKLPTNVFLPPSWTCSENIWDSSRSSCGAQEEMSSKELGDVFKISKDFKKRKVGESLNLGQQCEPSGLDALATAATLGDHDQPSAGATTRHPRHRPGCSCIVCIQPPSGKGKHKSSCVCNVCMTVKRRFKTLMMRKKKRQCDHEAEMVKQNSHDRPIKGIRFVKNASPNDVILAKHYVENDVNQPKNLPEEGESSGKGHIDLNLHPIREDLVVDVQSSAALVNLAQTARDPLDIYGKPNGLTTPLYKQKQPEGDSYSLQQANGYGDRRLLTEESNPSTVKVSAQCEGDDECSKKSILD